MRPLVGGETIKGAAMELDGRIEERWNIVVALKASPFHVRIFHRCGCRVYFVASDRRRAKRAAADAKVPYRLRCYECCEIELAALSLHCREVTAVESCRTFKPRAPVVARRSRECAPRIACRHDWDGKHWPGSRPG